MRKPINPDASTADRLAALESNFQQVDEDIDGIYSEIDEKSKELNNKIQQEANERQIEIGRIESRLDHAATGNLTILAFGVVWLAVGVVISTLAPEIAKIAAGQFRAVLEAL